MKDIKMKALLFILFQISFLISATCQSNWFLSGTRWSYDFISYVGPGITQLEVLPNDTLIGNKNFKKLLSTTIYNVNDTFKEFHYVREENNLVYSYDQYGGEFLYDFNAEVGDTLEYMRLGGLSAPFFVVDSIGTLDMNGTLLTFQNIKFEDPYDPEAFTEMRVVERMGSVSSYFLHSRLVIQPFDAPFYFPRCYEDPVVGIVRLSWDQGDCKFLATDTTSTLEILPDLSIVVPNPASDFILFTTDDSRIAFVQVVGISGSRILTYIKIKQQDLTINIRDLDSGIYFIVATDERGTILSNKKIVKY